MYHDRSEARKQVSKNDRKKKGQSLQKLNSETKYYKTKEGTKTHSWGWLSRSTLPTIQQNNLAPFPHF